MARGSQDLFVGLEKYILGILRKSTEGNLYKTFIFCNQICLGVWAMLVLYYRKRKRLGE